MRLWQVAWNLWTYELRLLFLYISHRCLNHTMQAAGFVRPSGQVSSFMARCRFAHGTMPFLSMIRTLYLDKNSALDCYIEMTIECSENEYHPIILLSYSKVQCSTSTHVRLVASMEIRAQPLSILAHNPHWRQISTTLDHAQIWICTERKMYSVLILLRRLPINGLISLVKIWRVLYRQVMGPLLWLR